MKGGANEILSAKAEIESLGFLFHCNALEYGNPCMKSSMNCQSGFPRDPHLTSARQRSPVRRQNGNRSGDFHFLAIFPENWKLLPVNLVFQIR
jgi:hypothetical protein